MNTKLQITDIEEEKPATKAVSIIDYAIANNASFEQMQQLIDMQRSNEIWEAKKEFNSAMGKFRANAPNIIKDSHVNYTSQKGTTDYKHASLGNVVKAISQSLAKEGLSHRWTSTQSSGIIEVTCILSHSLGHSETTSMSSAYDSSGGKNAVQAIGSTKTYLERYTLLGITGCATEEDSDGIAAEDRLFITEPQIEVIEKLAKSANKLDGFCKFYNIESASNLQQRDYKEAVDMLEKAVRKAAK